MSIDPSKPPSLGVASNLPTPDFTYDPTRDLRARRRPYRRGSYRLEPDSIGNKLLIHNYGHGGAGITMAQGCALEVRDLVQSSGRASAGTAVAILGGGVMGLTVATVLEEMELKVALYAESFTDTTSHIAGGQWSPSLVEEGNNHSDKVRFERVLTRAFRGYEAMIGRGYGVSRRPNFVYRKPRGFRKVPPSLIRPIPVASLPFDGHNHLSGYRYDTLLVEPPIFLERLRRDLRAKNVPMHHETFFSPSQVLSLSEPIIINCTGLGSGDIWNDSRLIPKKGQLIYLRPQPALRYLYSGARQRGYIFPRQDAVVVGGTVENVNDDRVDPQRCARIIQSHKEAFEGRISMVGALMLPRWYDRST